MPARPEAAVAFTLSAWRALNGTFGDHLSRALHSTAVAGCGPSSSVENKNSWGVSTGTATALSAGGPLNSSASPPGNPVLDNDGGCCRKLPEDLQRVVEGVDIDRHGRAQSF
jgi:hypothetical protein